MDTLSFFELDAKYKKEILDWVDKNDAKGSSWELREASPKEIYKKYTQDHFWNQTDYVDDQNIEKLKKLIRRNGFTRPVLIDEIHPDGPWLEGLHRTAAAYALRLPMIPILYRVS